MLPSRRELGSVKPVKGRTGWNKLCLFDAPDVGCVGVC